ncbi:hypothetical protein CCR98_02120 [Stenotrophomonas sp. WZN-1]|nr:hypothetical protein CCR98_02120 [Stenotrophomonas sp. WZN-1]
MRLLGLDRATNETNNFVRASNNRDVYKAALDLGPFGLNATVRPADVLLKCLVQYADDDKTPLTATSCFGQLLQQIDVLARCSGSLKQLTHFVKDDEHATNIRIFGALD